MITPNDIITLARSQIGVKESPKGSNKVIYNTAYYGREVSGNNYPWCCAFIWWLFTQCKAASLFYGGKKTASCTTLMNHYKTKGQFSKTAKVGSLAFFNWGKGSVAKHIGLVTSINGNTITTIEGNTSVDDDSNGGEVMERTRNINQVLGFAYPYAAAEKIVTVTLPQVQKGSVNESVTALQQLLKAKGYDPRGIDGDFGANTDAAFRKFQRAEGLVVDGVCGAKSWTALLT